jgi:tetratricopeptide (TPR) repeat protein
MTNNKLLELARDQEYQEVLNNFQNYSLTKVVEVADFLREEDIYQVAMSLYRYLLRQQEVSDYHYGIGQCHGKIYNYNLALWHLEKAFALESKRSGANYYAYILERNFQIDRAKKWYQEALKNGYDRDLWTLSHYAYFLEKNNQQILAQSYYEEVLQFNPAYTWAIKRYAIFLLNDGQWQKSLELMQNALQNFPKNPFVKLNYLEYLIICNMGKEYEAYLASIDYDNAPFPFQVLVDLFDYFWQYLLRGESDLEKVQTFEQKVSQLKDSIHRDFDDLNQILANNNGDQNEWQRLIAFLLL